MYLDTLSPLRANVGYGQLGTHGSLGYDSKTVQVKRQPYQHAFSAHPPARLVFNLGGRFSRFCCQVALNDDVPSGISPADLTLSTSVVIPAWNARATLEQCLIAIEQSSFNRKYPQQLEVVVVDDGSSDGTWVLIMYRGTTQTNNGGYHATTTL